MHAHTDTYMCVHVQEVISTLWGLSRLRVQLPERAVALLLRGGLGAAVLAPPAAAAASTAAAAAAAHQGDESDDVGSTAGAASPAQRVRARPNRLGHRAAAAGAAAGGPVAGPGDLAGAALVLARCRVVPDGRWMSRFYAAVARELQRFGPRCACACWECARGMGARECAGKTARMRV